MCEETRHRGPGTPEILIGPERSRRSDTDWILHPRAPRTASWNGQEQNGLHLAFTLCWCNCWATTSESISLVGQCLVVPAKFSPHQRERVVALLIETRAAAAALPGRGNGFDSCAWLNVKLWGALFDLLLQNVNRAGSARSIIYARSFSVSCLSARVAVTCPDSNGRRPGENIYQRYRKVLSSSVWSLSALLEGRLLTVHWS